VTVITLSRWIWNGVSHRALHNQIEKSGKAAVVLSGELYGPPHPEPKLPEPFRSDDSQGWGYLDSFPMKGVVFRIDSFASAGKPYSER
jgi:hypothetical protein